MEQTDISVKSFLLMGQQELVDLTVSQPQMTFAALGSSLPSRENRAELHLEEVRPMERSVYVIHWGQISRGLVP